MTALTARRISLSLAAVFLSGCGTPSGGDPSADVSPAVDEATLRAEVLAVEDSMNLAVDRLDCDGGLASMRETEPLFVSNGNVVRTRGQLGAMCERMVAPRTGAVFTVDSRTANLLSDAAAVVVREGNYAISFTDGTTREVYMVMTTVWARESDGWKMVHLHESSRPLDAN